MKAIESNNMWYFRRHSSISSDDGDDASISLPVDQITGMTPGPSNALLRIYFVNLGGIHNVQTIDATQNAYIQLNIDAGRAREVMEFLVQAANSKTHHQGYRTIFDAHTGESAFKHIKGVQNIHNH